MLWIDQQLVQSIHRDFKYISLIIWAGAMLWSSTWPRNSEGKAVMARQFSITERIETNNIDFKCFYQENCLCTFEKEKIDWMFYVKMWQHAQIENSTIYIQLWRNLEENS